MQSLRNRFTKRLIRSSRAATLRRRSLSLAAASLFGALLLYPFASAHAGLLAQLETEIQRIAADVSPSVVTVRAVKTNAFAGEAREVYVGTGVVFDSGWVLTTPSVVAAGVKYSIQATNEVPVAAELVGYDPTAETAVFHAPGLRAKPAAFRRDSVILPGQVLLVLGNAYGVESAVSWGIAAGMQENGFWQVGVNVAPGTSGSPVVNSRGEVIGIVAAALTDRPNPESSFGGTVAIVVPSARAHALAQQIKETGVVGRAFLGIRPETVDADMAKALGLTQGVYVGAVSFGSPAETYGLRTGDVLVGLDDIPLRSDQDLRRTLASRCPGEQVQLTVVRNQKLNHLNVQLGQAPELLPAEPGAAPAFEYQVTAPKPVKPTDSASLRRQIHELERQLEALKSQLDSQ